MAGDGLRLLVMRVQITLMAKGYDPGAVDGEITPPMRDALKKFQTDKGLKATGTMTTETLNALGVKVR